MHEGAGVSFVSIFDLYRVYIPTLAEVPYHQLVCFIGQFKTSFFMSPVKHDKRWYDVLFTV